jgi:MFS family permease
MSATSDKVRGRASILRAIPGTVWVLGMVSLFMDMSSELVHSLMPVFLVDTLGASALAVGLIEGVAESTALIVKVFSGAISDWAHRRKGLVLLGYGLSAFTKPLFPLATGAGAVFAARVLDRIGKGIRGAPRDALVADVAPPDLRGASFGLRQSMDTVGAVLGPTLAIALMITFHDHIRVVLWFAVLPAMITVALIIFGVRESRHDGAPTAHPPMTLALLRRFTPAYWWIVAVGAVFTLARFSEAFLVLQAQNTGLSITWVPLVMVVMSAFYTASAYPAGKWSDTVSRSALLTVGLVLLIGADILLAHAATVPLMMAGVALWGLHMGFSQGILAAMVADVTPPEYKGTAFGVFNLVSGAAMLIASGLAGALWQAYGAFATFYAGGGFAMAALAMLTVMRKVISARAR